MYLKTLRNRGATNNYLRTFHRFFAYGKYTCSWFASVVDFRNKRLRSVNLGEPSVHSGISIVVVIK